MTAIGTIVSLFRYPVKSLAPQQLQTTEVHADGFPGDRAQALFVTAGHAREGKPYRGKEHNRFHLTQEASAAVELAQERGVALAVQDELPHYYDAGEVSIVFEHWVHDISERVGYELEPLRFRPNIVARASDQFHDSEAQLSGALLSIGNVSLRVLRPIVRCVVPSYNLRDGASDPEVHRKLVQERENLMGVYCAVEQTGTLQVGETIFLSR